MIYKDKRDLKGKYINSFRQFVKLSAKIELFQYRLSNKLKSNQKEVSNQLKEIINLSNIQMCNELESPTLLFISSSLSENKFAENKIVPNKYNSTASLNQ